MIKTIDLIRKLEVDEINNRFIAEESISEGMGAKSFKGKDKKTGDTVFIKYLLFPANNYEIAKFKNEMEMTKLVTKFNFGGAGSICAEYIHSETLFNGNVYCLITKWYSFPTLEKWLRENPSFTIDQRLELIHRIINAVSRIPCKIDHRDLHPGNILIEDIEVDWHQRISNVGIKIIDWGESITNIYNGYDEPPDYFELLISTAPKKVEGSFYSLPPEVFTPWEDRKHQFGKYDAWAIAFLMYKVLTNKDVIEHKDIGSYIHTLNTNEMGNILRRANQNILALDHPASLLLANTFEKITNIDPKIRKDLSYVGRIVWDIRIENFVPNDIFEKHEYLEDPFEYCPKGGWKYSDFDVYD
ncbi:hypothetical protein D0907_11920 [Pseudoalteromonas lipolytica]|uniref:Protein kinase domain-containing protein n=1 Tax=Pseudoalteromonas lipolytica TaxID=570156 RepID=A0AAD0S0H2_9GAMM|nr:serine/threonine-protein kinase [Pseudoalteromonas donghaensis]AXV65925.1 hypothetical protein D0907_11920 [Pseudoalteromonas donghaensis]